MRFSLSTFIRVALTTDIMLRISCQSSLAISNDTNWSIPSNSSVVPLVDGQRNFIEGVVNESVSNASDISEKPEERKVRTYYTPENISLLLDALIGNRRGDWRATGDEPVIIWSHESKYHPSFGKRSPGIIEKETLTSRYISFAILGVVITFIIYAYLNHLFAMRLQRKTQKQESLRQLIQQSALIMATSANAQNVHLYDRNGRRLSILNLFHAFRL